MKPAETLRDLAKDVVRLHADDIAEDLLAHAHNCPARTTILCLLAVAELGERVFLESWVIGAFAGEQADD